jgi:hypothetical protein
MTDYDALDPDDAWSEPESPEPEAWSSDHEQSPPRPQVDDEVLVAFDAGETADDPHSSTWVRVDSPWHAGVDPNASGEWIADVERPAES